MKKIIFVFVLMLASAIISLGIGQYPMTLCDIAEICLGIAEDSMMVNVFLKIRLPRVIFDLLAGASLSVSGLIYQELFRNPLVSPDVIGVSGGASVGAVLGILLQLGSAAVTSFSLVGGFVAAALAMILSKFAYDKSKGTLNRTVGLILAGVVVKAFADSAVMAMKYLADPENQLPTIDYRLMGSFGNVRGDDVLLALPLCIIPIIFLGLLMYRISVLSVGDEDAAGLGAEVKLIKYLCVGLAAIPVAAVTAVTGVIAWVGLIGPHAVRMIFGEGFRNNFWLCIFMGGAFMTVADTAARSLTSAEIPVSIITSLAGAVLLFVFLFRREKRGAA